MKQIRTDLAMEDAADLDREHMPGVHISEWEAGGVTMTEVSVESEEGARLLGKPQGLYITMECPRVRRRDIDARRAVSVLLGEELARLLPPGEGSVLVIGLGNRSVTPDSLGPLAVDHMLVTRHIYRERPDLTSSAMSSVCAVAPGVMGTTGIESGELVRAAIEAVRPRAVIAVDSLSARALDRLSSTVQLTNTGIQPGSGVGNHRAAMTQETLGVPVLAVGVPMVIHAAALARDAFRLLSGEDETRLDALMRELMDGDLGDMIVTPREVDDLVDNAAVMLAGGINRALHPGLSDAEILTMMQ